MRTFTILALFACGVLAATMAGSPSSEMMPAPAMIGDLSNSEDAARKSAALKKNPSRSASSRAHQVIRPKTTDKRKPAHKKSTHKNSRKTRAAIDFFMAKKSSTTTTTTTAMPVPAVPSIDNLNSLNQTATVNATEAVIASNVTASLPIAASKGAAATP